MNYFAHGRDFVDQPFFLAGTAVPDWLGVIDRSIRARTRRAEPFLECDDPELAALAAGVCRHHHDDAWFHGTRAFTELSLGLTVAIRDSLPPDAGFRPSFLGHILVEILLDAVLIEREPARIDAYYAAFDGLDGERVEALVARITGRGPAGLAHLVRRFSAERFLLDYLEDGKLCFRLNQVLRRVGLPPLPARFETLLPAARDQVRSRQEELLTPHN